MIPGEWWEAVTSDLLVADAPTSPSPPSRRRLGRWLAFALVVVVAAGAALALWSGRPQVEDPSVAAQELATTWSRRGLVAASFADEPAPPPRRVRAAVTAELSAEPPSVSVVEVVPPPDDQPLATTATLAVDWTLPGDREWSYETSVTLVRAPEALTWEVAWDPRIVHPDLTVGERLAVGRQPAERGRVVGESGGVLVGPERVTRVGLQPSRIDDVDETVDALVAELDEQLDIELDGDEIKADVAAADPDHFVPVVVLRNDDYRAVEPVVFPLPGTTFRDDVLYLAPTRDFASLTLGSVGPVTAEQLEEFPGRWEEGDLAGRSGLQAAQDTALAGTPGWTVEAVGDDGTTGAVLHTVEPVAGADLVITLDARTQRLAQRSLRDVETPAALAVVRPSDGAVLALANSPSATFDIARSWQLPPGSVFKVVTTGALMQDAGVTPDTPVACPNTIDVGNRTISNAGSLALGDTTFDRGFANSCNSVFIALSEDLGPSSLTAAGRQFGIGEDVAWPFGMDAFTGSVPATEDRWDQALASFGQGRTLVSPLDLATVMATVADGERVLPHLVVDASTTDEESTNPDADADVAPLPADVVTALQDLTRLVVTDGSGGAVQDLPGAPVHGKTGTAEFTDADGERSQHVWFAGYRDDLAFALVVTDVPDGSGGGTAAPLVRDFLERLDD